jgi:hypothetical protein
MTALFNFVSSFGTHVITGATLGGTATVTSTFNESDFATLKGQSGSVSDNARLHFLEKFMMSSPASFPFRPPSEGYKQCVALSCLTSKYLSCGLGRVWSRRLFIVDERLPGFLLVGEGFSSSFFEGRRCSLQVEIPNVLTACRFLQVPKLSQEL